MSIISLLNRVRQGELVLPNIQRRFVWTPDAICKLMDSIMRGYRRYSSFITDRSEKIRAHVLAKLEMTEKEFRKAE